MKSDFSANDAGSLLSVERIFESNEFAEERLPKRVWSQNSESYFTLMVLEGGGKGPDLIRVDIASGETTRIATAADFTPTGQERPLNIDGFEFSSDESKLLIFTNSRRVWRYPTRGDYWMLDLGTRKLTQLDGDAAPSTLKFAKFSPDGSRVAFVRDKNLYVQNLENLQIIALTSDRNPHLINGTSDWVNEEELQIRDGYRWSPDGRSIAFWQFDTTGVEEFHLIDNTAGTYPRITSFPYPKVGHQNSSTRLGVVSVAGGPARWLDVPGDPREHYLPRMEWTPDGRQLLLQQMNRLQNTNLVMLANPETGTTRTILTEKESAWLENDNPVRWVNEGRGFVWLSERDGWRHAYLAGTVGKQWTQITQGDFDLIQIEAIDREGGWLYYAASPDNPTQRYLYRVRLDGTSTERLSPADQPGWHTYDISPDCRWAVHSYSSFMTPPRRELIQLQDHSVHRVLTDNANLRQKLATLQQPSAEFFRVDIGERLELDGWCLKPPGFDPEKQYPLFFYVYGEPHGQTVRDAWHIRGLWHWMLAQQGYLVVSVDNRGTNSPRGRDWRKCVYRKIGIIAPVEQAAATRALLGNWPFADPDRVGIWGWSGGGSMSLNAIFRYPELYSMAIAVAPNANQLLYDTIYQERYMGLPDDNAEGYRLGSPITYASQLQGDLLLVHGTGDDNGHYQGTESLINELIKHDKQFTVMPYPARSHSISEGDNTVPHFYSLLTFYLLEHLPAEVAIDE